MVLSYGAFEENCDVWEDLRHHTTKKRMPRALRNSSTRCLVRHPLVVAGTAGVFPTPRDSRYPRYFGKDRHRRHYRPHSHCVLEYRVVVVDVAVVVGVVELVRFAIQSCVAFVLAHSKCPLHPILVVVAVAAAVRSSPRNRCWFGGSESPK